MMASSARREVALWDPTFTERVKNVVGPLVRRYFRAEVRGVDQIPPSGGVLFVSNHSGGMLTPDVFVLATAYYERFGYGRPLYTLAHSMILVGSLGATLRRVGAIEASRGNAAQALRNGAAVLVFPGGDYDAYRPTSKANVIDFNGRTGYVRTALEAGVPIVPIVSIGGQESQWFLSRGSWLAKRLGLSRFRAEIMPLTVGIPFGLGIFVPNLPLPAKIVTEVLAPIDVRDRWGADADVDEVDRHVRRLMQDALDALADGRRFPIIG
ncbi:lysophospholipid acyltransferase family protein [Mycobacterium sp. EPa45]|uniref:lysophospholipid acyltransferase family protein n=1 Tax=Mycobacterium sp. EPa45 TaxID=1545728 RepID=UPI0006419E08|nr:glycerol acyltransferase [Mycobacterium sp. EPa45]